VISTRPNTGKMVAQQGAYEHYDGLYLHKSRNGRPQQSFEKKILAAEADRR